MSIESIASTPQIAAASASCASCGSPLAEDQRYCLHCGERISPPSSVLLGGPPLQAAAVESSASLVPPGYAPPGVPGAQGDGERRGNAVTIIAGVGVLLLAMGVGVLIGRSSASGSNAPVSPVINVATAPASTGSPAASEAAFTSDWPAGTNGYTVQLQTLPSASTALSAVEAAKSAATAKGREVGRRAEVRRIREPRGGQLRRLLGRLLEARRSEQRAEGLEEELPDGIGDPRLGGRCEVLVRLDLEQNARRQISGWL